MSKKLIYLVSFVFVLGLVLTSAANANLIGWWRFDDDFLDSSGQGNDGVPEGNPTFVAGKVGNALQLGGSDYVVIDAVADDKTVNDITLCLWLKTSSNDAEIIAINTSGAGNVMRLAVDSGSLVIDESDPQGHSTTPIDDGEWHFLTYVRNGATGYIYVDGVQENSYAAGFSFSANDLWSIGQEWDSGGPSGFLTGTVDDVYVYDRALTDDEIQAVMKGVGYPYALGPSPADGDYIEDTWVNLSWRPGDFALSHDVYLGENLNDVTNGTGDTFKGNQAATSYIVGFPGFPYPDGLVPGTTYYWRIDEVNDTEPNSPWTGKVWSFTVPPKTSYLPDPADGTELVDLDVRLSWTAGFGSKLHYIYFGDNFDDVNNAAGGLPQGTATYTPGTLEMAKTYYWRVDEFDVIGTYKGDVWSFTTQGAVESLDPVNGAVDVKQTQIIKWSPSVFAASHQIYFGTDKDTVRNADSGSPEYKGTSDLDSESYDPGKLEWDTTYYWRIDEVNNANTDSPWVGNVWSFTTANFLIVDDFESYNDLDPADPDSNRIFNVWLDGYGVPTNGSLVGYENPPFAEQTIVHGGSQSMPLYYDNSVGYSEATLTLTYPRDWTEKGVDTLTIWFRGSSTNAAETLYVALNGSAVVNNDNPDAAQTGSWTEWSIPLQAFADQGVNLADVNTIALGLGDKNNPQAGGSGTMYFDDIQLYPPAP
ncbi:MAG TPA: LamG domain-containing protein [Sedimentisphaerales bacterium]|nr:LamG domain-containing protein [Sedimentisphaerales bacterium]